MGLVSRYMAGMTSPAGHLIVMMTTAAREQSVQPLKKEWGGLYQKNRIPHQYQIAAVYQTVEITMAMEL